MTAGDLLATLTAQGCRLLPDGAQLRVQDPEHTLTDALREGIRMHKAALLTLLSQPVTSAPDSDIHALLASIRNGPFAAMSGQTIQVPEEILCRMGKQDPQTRAYVSDACPQCGGDVWLVKVITRVCVACGSKEGQDPAKILQARP